MEKEIIFSNLIKLDHSGRIGFVGIKSITIPSQLRKEFKGRVEKHTSGTYIYNPKYKRTLSATPMSITPHNSGKTKIIGFKCLSFAQKSGKYLLSLKVVKTKSVYYLDSKPTTKEHLIEIGALPKPNDNQSFNGYITMGIDSIVSINHRALA